MTISNADLAQQIVDLVTKWNVREDQMVAWLGGTPTGGPGNDGLYPLTNELGVTYMVACPAKMVSVTQKGDPAKVAAVIEVFVKPPPSVIIGGYRSPGIQTFTNTACIGYVKGALPTNDAVFTVKKNGSVVGTITILAGTSYPIFNLTGGQVSLVRGDILEVVSPSTQDPTLTGPSFTFAGD